MPGDGLVWAAFGLLLVVMAARAWIVETGVRGVDGRAPARVRALTVTAGIVALGVVVLVAVQGGIQLAGLLFGGS